MPLGQAGFQLCLTGHFRDSRDENQYLVADLRQEKGMILSHSSSWLPVAQGFLPAHISAFFNFTDK